MMKKLLIMLMIILLAFTGCTNEEPEPQDIAPDLSEMEILEPDTGTSSEVSPVPECTGLSEVYGLEYDGTLVINVNDGIPFFTEDDLRKLEPGDFILSGFDELGRTGPAMMLATASLMPKGERGSTGMTKPSGWCQNRYPGLVDSDPPYLYNRSHLLAWALTGLTDRPENLITGTRYFNAEGMLSVELDVIHVVERGEDVLYRVTPVYEGDNRLASGVLMEAQSLDGAFSLCRYVFNVQPGVVIDYRTGENHASNGEESAEQLYILNTHTMKFHLPECDAVDEMNPANKKEYTGTRDDLISEGYTPCGACHP